MSQLNIDNLSWFYEAAFFVVCVLLFVMHLLCSCVWNKTKCIPKNANQTADVWNISGRVTRERPVMSEPTTRWPTHDNHISVDSFVIPDNFQPYKTDKIPPPPYCEVDLPTYEQATVNPKDTIITPSIHVTPSSSRVQN